jgi:hypothetical protein
MKRVLSAALFMLAFLILGGLFLAYGQHEPFDPDEQPIQPIQVVPR